VGVVGMEEGAFVGRMGQEDDGAGGLVDGGELRWLVVLLIGAATQHVEDFDAPHVAVGGEVDLELAVVAACREVADAHNLGPQSFVCDGVEDEAVGEELGVHVLVAQFLSEVE